jgi:hypothetical protein
MDLQILGEPMLKPVIRMTCFCSLMTLADAQSVDLTGPEISALIAGATAEIDTPLGARLPISYARDGQLTGDARQLALYLGATSDTGRWWVASDQLCHQWTQWFGSEPQCLRLRKEGGRIRWWNQNGTSGTAVLTAAPTKIAISAAAATGGWDARLRNLAEATAPASAALQTRLPAQPATAAGEQSTPAETPVAALLLPDASARAPGKQPTSTPATPPSPGKRATDAAYMVANVERDDVLNVRRGPSTEFDVIGELQPGSRGVAITGACRSGWCPVQHEATRGWVNRTYLAIDERLSLAPITQENSARANAPAADAQSALLRDPADAPRTCLTPPALALLERIEEKFGPVKLVSTCRPGAIIAGTGRPSRHASGNAVDFNAGTRKNQIIEWLIANHHAGGTMTYADMDHIHVDIGPYFVSIAGGLHWASWRPR